MLVPHGVHILVVDGSRMALFRNQGRGPAPKLELLLQEQDVAPPTSAIGADQPGRSFSGKDGSRAAYEQTDLHQLIEDQFASRACAKLEAMLVAEGGPVILVAAPRVLGLIRKGLTPQIRQRVIAEIDKNYAGRTANEVAHLLTHYEP
jgi:protein required for attachment to host cells